jgi:hypothetical protein
LQSVAIITKRAWLQAETLEETAVTVNIKGAFFQQLNQFLDAQNISLVAKRFHSHSPKHPSFD